MFLQSNFCFVCLAEALDNLPKKSKQAIWDKTCIQEPLLKIRALNKEWQGSKNIEILGGKFPELFGLLVYHLFPFFVCQRTFAFRNRQSLCGSASTNQLAQLEKP